MDRSIFSWVNGIKVGGEKNLTCKTKSQLPSEFQKRKPRLLEKKSLNNKNNHVNQKTKTPMVIVLSIS